MEENQMTIVASRQRRIKGKVDIDIERCKGCELCTIECKEGALTIGDAINSRGYRYAISNNNLCTGCVNCALVCPDAVISVYRTIVKKKKWSCDAEAKETIAVLPVKFSVCQK